MTQTIEYTTPNGQTSQREYTTTRNGPWVCIVIMKQSGRRAETEYSFNTKEQRWAYNIVPAAAIAALVTR